MKFLPLLGKRLKDDEIIDFLESAEMEVVYDFDRLHENQPDKYWATAKDRGVQFGFDADQSLELIFLYAVPAEDFSAVDRSESDVPFFSTVAEAEMYAAQEKAGVTKGEAEFLRSRRHWVRLACPNHSLHYEFREGFLTLVTVSKAK
jgi:hypothetical protein